jgi:hypothetical protein
MHIAKSSFNLSIVKRFARAQSIAKQFLVSLHTNACIGECENLSKGVKKNPTLDILVSKI